MQTHLMPSELASHRKTSETAKSLAGKPNTQSALLCVGLVEFKRAATPVTVRGGWFQDITHVDAILLCF